MNLSCEARFGILIEVCEDESNFGDKLMKPHPVTPLPSMFAGGRTMHMGIDRYLAMTDVIRRVYVTEHVDKHKNSSKLLQGKATPKQLVVRSAGW